VDDIVSLTHGKGEMASRDGWTSVATARHNRDAKGKVEPALDVLEKFLGESNLITGIQRESWSGDYHLTVLHELLRRLALEMNLSKVSDVAELYVKAQLSPNFNNLIFEIGQGAVGFNELRGIDEWAKILAQLGVASKPEKSTSEAGSGTQVSGPTKGQGVAKVSAKGGSAKSPASSASKAMAVTDSRYLPTMLKKLVVYGNGREKIVALKDEASKLNVEKHPLSFCFTLRSMLELSARAYCTDNGISLTEHPKGKTSGKMDKKLIAILREAKDDILLKLPKEDKAAITKELHGAFAELNLKESFLSVTTLNQLIHGATMMTSSGHISAVFANLLPLLQHLNAPKP